jgi:hypothetical protein
MEAETAFCGGDLPEVFRVDVNDKRSDIEDDSVPQRMERYRIKVGPRVLPKK